MIVQKITRTIGMFVLPSFFILLYLSSNLSATGGADEVYNIEIQLLDIQYGFQGAHCGDIDWDAMLIKGFNISITNLYNNDHSINQIILTESLLDQCGSERFVRNISLADSVSFPIILAPDNEWQYQVDTPVYLHYFSYLSVKIDESRLEKPLEGYASSLSWHLTDLEPAEPRLTVWFGEDFLSIIFSFPLVLYFSRKFRKDKISLKV